MSKNLSSPRVRFGFGRNFFILLFLLLLFCPLQNVFASPNTDTMLGYWKFDGNATDFSGDGSTGLLSGTTMPNYSSNTPTTSFSNTNSINFAATGSYVTFSNQSNLKPSAGLTFSTWIYLNAVPASQSIIAGSYAPGNNNYGYYLEMDTANVAFAVGNGTTRSLVSFPISGNLPVGTWKLLTATWDGTVIKLFLNGVNMGSTAFSGSINYTGTTFVLGNVNPSNFNGKLDDVRLYGRALYPSSEISDLVLGKHTTGSWVGTSTNYDDPNNWSPAAVPDPYTNVNISGAASYPILTSQEEVASMYIGSTASLDLANQNFIIHDGGTFTNNGTLKLESAATQTISGLANDTDSGTVEIYNSLSNVNTLKTGSSYYNLKINPSSSYSVNLSAALVVNGNLILASGYLNALTSGIYVNVKGDWQKDGGEFVSGTSTVNLNGGDQTIYGANTFYNLTKTSSVSDRLGFMYGATQIIRNKLTLQGPTSGLLNLRSSVPGTQWLIDPQGARTIGDVDVKDSNNINATQISATSGSIVNSGNNVGWIFDDTPPTITLNAYSAVTSETKLPISGIASDSKSTVEQVQFQMDSTSGIWTDCSMTDSLSSGSTSEAFVCTPSSDLPEGTYKMYIRSIDAYGNVTQAAEYSVADFEIDKTAPSLTLDSISSPTSSDQKTVTGVATEPKLTVSLVSFQIDSTSGTWADCDPKDGAFDSSSENFSCKPASELDDGLHVIYVRAKDSEDNVTSDSNLVSVSFEVDTKAPDISSVSSDPDSDSVKISWNTDEKATSSVEYGKTDAYGKSSKKSERVKDHSLTISSLDSCTKYHYQVKSKDEADNEEKSSDHTFKTTGCTTTSTSSEENSTSSTSSSATETSSTGSANTQTVTTNTTSTKSDSIVPNTTNIAPADSNFNGTTNDDWQVKYFGNAYCANENICGGSADPDGDGITNNDEFRLGTDPNSADSDKDGTTDSAEIESGHDPTKSSRDREGDSITYENPKENGTVAKEKYEVKNVEIIESDGSKKMKISGKGPPNTYVTVYVYSDPIVLTVKTDKDGNWSYVLDQDVGDGQHEVYVAVTDSAGKVAEKSEPLAFIKTAEAVTIIPPAEAAAAERAESPTEAWYKGGIFLFISIVFAGLLLAVGSIGIYKHRMSKQAEAADLQQKA